MKLTRTSKGFRFFSETSYEKCKRLILILPDFVHFLQMFHQIPITENGTDFSENIPRWKTLQGQKD